MQNQNTKLYQAAAGLLPLLAGISMLILPFVTGAGRYGALLPLLLARMQFRVVIQAAIASAMMLAGILVLYRRSVRTLIFAAAASAAAAIDLVVLLVHAQTFLSEFAMLRYDRGVTKYGPGFWLALLFADAALILCMISLRDAAVSGGNSAADIRTAFTSDMDTVHQITCVSGEFAGASFPLNPHDTVVIGRDSEVCNIVISAGKVSRRHCAVSFDAAKGQFAVMDCSTNGTYLENGTRLLANLRNMLPAGTGISIGSNENRFKLE